MNWETKLGRMQFAPTYKASEHWETSNPARNMLAGSQQAAFPAVSMLAGTRQATFPAVNMVAGTRQPTLPAVSMLAGTRQAIFLCENMNFLTQTKENEHENQQN